MLHLRYHLHILTLQALAVRSTLHPHVVALTVVLEAVALQALAFYLYCSASQEELLTVSAIFAFAFRSAGLSQLEALAVVLLAARLGASTLPDGLGVGTSRGGAVGGLQLSLFLHQVLGDLHLCGLIIVVERALLDGLWLGAKHVQQIRVIFGFFKSINHDHNLLFGLHLLLPFLHLHIDCKKQL